jgi:hypothetical protein
MTTPGAEQRARGGADTLFIKTKSMGKKIFLLIKSKFFQLSLNLKF